MAELGPDSFYTLSIFPLLSSKETEETKQKFWIKHYLVAIWYTGGYVYSLQCYVIWKLMLCALPSQPFL